MLNPLLINYISEKSLVEQHFSNITSFFPLAILCTTINKGLGIFIIFLPGRRPTSVTLYVNIQIITIILKI